jgi:hypothetical protein
VEPSGGDKSRHGTLSVGRKPLPTAYKARGSSAARGCSGSTLVNVRDRVARLAARSVIAALQSILLTIHSKAVELRQTSPTAGICANYAKVLTRGIQEITDWMRRVMLLGDEA